MKWPRGKYNGQRITGFTVSLTVNVAWGVFWWPRAKWNFGEPVVSWLVFWLRFKAQYESGVDEIMIRAKEYQQQPPHPATCGSCGERFNNLRRMMHHRAAKRGKDELHPAQPTLPR